MEKLTLKLQVPTSPIRRGRLHLTLKLKGKSHVKTIWAPNSSRGMKGMSSFASTTLWCELHCENDSVPLLVPTTFLTCRHVDKCTSHVFMQTLTSHTSQRMLTVTVKLDNGAVGESLNTFSREPADQAFSAWNFPTLDTAGQVQCHVTVGIPNSANVDVGTVELRPKLARETCIRSGSRSANIPVKKTTKD